MLLMLFFIRRLRIFNSGQLTFNELMEFLKRCISVQKTMVLSCLLPFLLVCYILHIGAFRSAAFWQVRLCKISGNAYRSPAAQSRQHRAPVVQEFKPPLLFSSTPDALSTVDSVREASSSLFPVEDDASTRKKPGVINHFRSRIWSRVPWNVTTVSPALHKNVFNQ